MLLTVAGQRVLVSAGSSWRYSRSLHAVCQAVPGMGEQGKTEPPHTVVGVPAAGLDVPRQGVVDHLSRTREASPHTHWLLQLWSVRGSTTKYKEGLKIIFNTYLCLGFS